jgi:dihydrofolate reductase
MSKVFFDISMSLDGFIAGPNAGPQQGLGEGAEPLHAWMFALKAFREAHGLEGGEVNVDTEVVEETLHAAGAHVMGKGMFGGGKGAWDDKAWGDEPWNGFWGDDPPFHKPVVVLTHHAREPLTLGDTTFTFVTDGIESALGQARTAAGDKDVQVGGGANVIQQYLEAGLLDEFQIHVAPAFLGDGVRLFDNIDPAKVAVECTRVIHSPAVTHMRYRVVK